MLLSQPEAHAKLCPVCGQSSGSVGIERFHPCFALPDYFPFGLLEGSFQFC